MIEDDSFADFWARERERIYRALALSLGDARTASEAVDEGMTRALERWSKISTYDRPAAWVYRVSLNWATSWQRKLSLRPTRTSDELDRPTADNVSDVDIEAALGGLRAEHRQALVMRYFLQFTPTEISQVLDLPVGTVKSHIHRGLERLRESRRVSR